MTKSNSTLSSWRIWMHLTWRWLVGGPKLMRDLASGAIKTEKARCAAEESAQEARREVFKNWSLVCAARDSTIIRIRPGTFTLHVQGPITDEVAQRLKRAWKESSLLIRLPFPFNETAPTGYSMAGDWKLAPYVLTEIE